MTRSKSLLSIGALVVVLWALSFAWQRSSSDDRAALARTQAELQALRAESERLRDAVSALQGRSAQPAQAAQAPGPAVTPELIARVKAAVSAQGPAAQPTVDLTPEQERADMLRYGEWLEGRLQRAPAAKDDTAASLKSKVSSMLGDGSAVLELDCTQEMCRMKTRHKDMDEYRNFQSRAFQDFEKRVWSGPIAFVVTDEPNEQGKPLFSSIYMGRGDALPSPNPPQ